MKIFNLKDYKSTDKVCNEIGQPVTIIGIIDATYPVVAKFDNPNSIVNGVDRELVFRFNSDGKAEITSKGQPLYHYRQLFIEENRLIKFNLDLINEHGIITKTRCGYKVTLVDDSMGGGFPLLFKVVFPTGRCIAVLYNYQGESYILGDTSMDLVMVRI